MKRTVSAKYFVSLQHQLIKKYIIMTSDYSLSVQQEYLSDWENLEIANLEAQEEMHNQELIQKSVWIRELLNDFEAFWNGDFYENGLHFNRFELNKTGLENVDFRFAKVEMKKEKMIFITRLEKEDLIESVAIAVFVHLEAKIETSIPTHQSDNELPF